MKKKILGGVAVIAIAALAAFNMNVNKQNNISVINIADIEALANGESGGGGNGGIGCYTQTVSACWSANGYSPGDQHVCIFNNVDAPPYRCGEINCYGAQKIRTCVGGNSPYN